MRRAIAPYMYIICSTMPAAAGKNVPIIAPFIIVLLKVGSKIICTYVSMYVYINAT